MSRLRMANKLKNAFNKALVDSLLAYGKKHKQYRYAINNSVKAIRNHILPIKTSEDAELLIGVGSFSLKLIDTILNNNSTDSIKQISETSVRKSKTKNSNASSQRRNFFAKEKRKGEQIHASIPEKPPIFSPLKKIKLGDSKEKFSLVLLIDSREKKDDKKFFVEGLEEILGKDCVEIRSLPIGDFLWILRSTTNEEYVMDVIIERKRIKDLESSIKDSRYKEQKYRLGISGIGKVIYLIEGNKLTSYMKPAIEQAIATTTCMDKFLVHESSNLTQTLKLLVDVTKSLFKKAETINNKNEHDFKGLIEYENFLRKLKKNFGIPRHVIFGRQLMCIPSVGHEKAMAIALKYQSCFKFYEECKKQCGDKKSQFIAEIEYGKQRRKIGEVCANAIFDFFIK